MWNRLGRKLHPGPATAVGSTSPRIVRARSRSGSSPSISPLSAFKSRTEAARILSSPRMANSSFTRKVELRTWRSGAGPSTATRNPVCSVPFEAAPAGAWVPDPDGIYFIEPAWRIAYYRFATGATTTIVPLRQDAVVANPGLALSPDGRWLLYGQRDRSGSDIMLIENFR